MNAGVLVLHLAGGITILGTFSPAPIAVICSTENNYFGGTFHLIPDHRFCACAMDVLSIDISVESIVQY